MKIKDVERLLNSHARLIVALETALLFLTAQPAIPKQGDAVMEGRAAIEGARMVREEIGRP